MLTDLIKHLYSDEVLCNSDLLPQEKINRIKEILHNDMEVIRDRATGKYCEANLSGFRSAEDRDQYIDSGQHFIANHNSGRNGWTLLCVCAENDYLEVAQWLIEEQGANIELGASYHQTPLYIAAGTGSLKMMRYLLEKGADINGDCDVRGGFVRRVDYTPLHEAVRFGFPEAVNLLLENKAEIREDGNQETPLQLGIHLQEIIYALNAGENHPDAERYLGRSKYYSVENIPTIENLEKILEAFGLPDAYTRQCYLKSQRPDQADKMTNGEIAAANDYLPIVNIINEAKKITTPEDLYVFLTSDHPPKSPSPDRLKNLLLTSCCDDFSHDYRDLCSPLEHFCWNGNYEMAKVILEPLDQWSGSKRNEILQDLVNIYLAGVSVPGEPEIGTKNILKLVELILVKGEKINAENIFPDIAALLQRRSSNAYTPEAQEMFMLLLKHTNPETLPKLFLTSSVDEKSDSLDEDYTVLYKKFMDNPKEFTADDRNNLLQGIIIGIKELESRLGSSRTKLAAYSFSMLQDRQIQDEKHAVPSDDLLLTEEEKLIPSEAVGNVPSDFKDEMQVFEAVSLVNPNDDKLEIDSKEDKNSPDEFIMVNKNIINEDEIIIRKLIIDKIAEYINYLNKDSYGFHWYAKQQKICNFKTDLENNIQTDQFTSIYENAKKAMSESRHPWMDSIVSFFSQDHKKPKGQMVCEEIDRIIYPKKD